MAYHDPELEALRRRFYDAGDVPEMPRLDGAAAASSSSSSSATGTGNAKGKERARPGATRSRLSGRAGRDALENGTGGAGDAMDIDFDLDADADADAGRTSTSTAATTAIAHDLNVPDRDRAHETDVHRLLRAWQNERHAPDVLPMEEGVLGRVLDAVRRQMTDVNTLRMDENLSEEDHYMMMLVQTEVERMKFVVRSYVRTRLWKIEKYAAYVTSKKEVQPRLTEAELRHARSFAELVVSQFRTTVLNHLPEAQQALDDDLATMPSMITEPDMEKPVFFRALEDCGEVMLPDGTAFTVTKGSIHLMRYRTIEQALLRGEVELV